MQPKMTQQTPEMGLKMTGLIGNFQFLKPGVLVPFKLNSVFSSIGYRPLAERIRKEGFMGVKAFFWAELTEQQDGTFKVFHGKTAPFQQW